VAGKEPINSSQFEIGDSRQYIDELKVQIEVNDLEDYNQTLERNGKKKSFQQRNQRREELSKSPLKQEPKEKFSSFDELPPLSAPEKSLKQAFLDIQSNDWEKQVQSLNTFRQGFKHHKQSFGPVFIHQLFPHLIKVCDSLRSALTKNAIMTMDEAF